MKGFKVVIGTQIGKPRDPSWICKCIHKEMHAYMYVCGYPHNASVRVIRTKRRPGDTAFCDVEVLCLFRI